MNHLLKGNKWLIDIIPCKISFEHSVITILKTLILHHRVLLFCIRFAELDKLAEFNSNQSNITEGY